MISPAEPIEITVEAAPLEELRADLLQAQIPAGSRLHGVEIFELRLPAQVNLALIVRGGRSFVPAPTTVLQAGDRLLIVTPVTARQQTERSQPRQPANSPAGSANTASDPGRERVPHIMTARRRRVPSAVSQPGAGQHDRRSVRRRAKERQLASARGETLACTVPRLGGLTQLPDPGCRLRRA